MSFCVANHKLYDNPSIVQKKEKKRKETEIFIDKLKLFFSLNEHLFTFIVVLWLLKLLSVSLTHGEIDHFKSNNSSKELNCLHITNNN